MNQTDKTKNDMHIRFARLSILASVILTSMPVMGQGADSGSTVDHAGRWHESGTVLEYGDPDTDGNVLYVVCDAGRIGVSVMVDGSEWQDGQHATIRLSSNSGKLLIGATAQLSDLDMYANGEVRDLARFYRLFDGTGDLHIVTRDRDIALPLRGAKAKIDRLKAACSPSPAHRRPPPAHPANRHD
ncbi:hypothetical protein [Burkholderia sp. S-53]|uniref:hypothetical protein n=1 Tax=Burkholderia sp. S-53 TaxID=2906514 RepID=UPI0021CF5FA8|nr:hypothetical protein [Burkholderia sp. S-53]UXU85383.1 hypothetical protein LXM88_03200 [Burkholderia sp. S-53]